MQYKAKNSMNLILSSCDFSNEKSQKIIIDNLPKPIHECRLLFVPNDKATREAIHSEKYYNWMQKRGFSKENITIFDHREPEQYFGLDIDVLYISGGNTFETLQKIRKCHFDTEMIRYIQAGVTYIGGSAGAHIVSADISHVSRYDTVPDGFADFHGLGLFDGVLICHFTSERQEHYDALKADGKYKVIALTDEDSIVVRKEYPYG